MAANDLLALRNQQPATLSNKAQEVGGPKTDWTTADYLNNLAFGSDSTKAAGITQDKTVGGSAQVGPRASELRGASSVSEDDSTEDVTKAIDEDEDSDEANKVTESDDTDEDEAKLDESDDDDDDDDDGLDLNLDELVDDLDTVDLDEDDDSDEDDKLSEEDGDDDEDDKLDEEDSDEDDEKKVVSESRRARIRRLAEAKAAAKKPIQEADIVIDEADIYGAEDDDKLDEAEEKSDEKKDSLDEDDDADSDDKLDESEDSDEKDPLAEDDDSDEDDKEKKVVSESIKVKILFNESQKLFEGSTHLTEEQKRQTKALFESAVRTVAKGIAGQLKEAYQARLNKAVSLHEKKTAKTVDKYLSYVVEEWVKENKVPLRSQIRSKLTENFLSKLRTLFVESYVEVPAGKVDAVKALASNVKTLKNRLKLAEEKNIKLHAAAKKATSGTQRALVSEHKLRLVTEAATGLPTSERGKFREFAKSLQFKDTKSYRKDLIALREQYVAADRGVKERPSNVPVASPLFEESAPKTAVNRYAEIAKLIG